MSPLTDTQRQQLCCSAEWRDIQVAMLNVYTYLGLTRLEDVQMQFVIEELQQISQRRAAFLEQFLHNQGGM